MKEENHVNRKQTLLPLLFFLLSLLLTGCWDTHELDKLFIVTGVALDQAVDTEQMDITLQIGQTSASLSGSGEANSPEEAIFLLKTASDTVMGGFIEFNRDGGYRLMLNHNQILLVGSDLAEQGIKKRIDMFVRDPQARLEIPFAIVDGRAESILSAELAQENNTGIFLANVFRDLSSVSRKYEVRLIDLISGLMDETAAPVAPILNVVRGDDGEEIKVVGMAVFQGDRMVGRLSNNQVLGYVWTMGNVRKSSVSAGNAQGKVVFYLNRLDCNPKFDLREDGGLRLTLDTNATLTVSEISGFNGTTQEELMPILKKLAEDEIRQTISDTFLTACTLKADIYGFGKKVHNQYPNEWTMMKDQWQDVFADMELITNVRVDLPSVGKNLQGLEMGETS